jgi:multiple sugar transport system permease protein
MTRAQTVLRAIATTAKYASLVAGCVIVVLPLLTIFLTSLKTPAEMAGGSTFTLPHHWLNLSNYATAFAKGDMVDGFANTAIILIVSVTGTVLIGTMAAYAIDRFEFRSKRVVVAGFLFAALVPGVTTQVATFQIVNGLHAYDTRWAPILLYLGTDIVAIYIFVQFMRGIPMSLDEAARLDGASNFKIYRSIILPLLRPAIVTVVIIKGIFVYNDFYVPFLYMPSDGLGTISTSLFRFKGPYGAHWETLSAGAVLVILPTLLLFLLLQRFIYSGVTSGATR